ncbi:alpha/beta fold hydrolase [Nocardia terpenica]|uniref:Alpha/beta hydrolase n=1 Tax=Nocardia terpenica TaxID=455432 RepID=A0A164LXH9_9NOCA|nr:alpha/beta hydrolase [Nocardia terpenica]KZM72843.1 alpha/beta hydrolase [Nocardia terpenica]NQE92244.1 alpha/beta fold hydrolase [Nocardia terpenica]
MPVDIVVDHVRANGIQLRVATAGRGPAVLLLHGFPHTWQLWRPVIDHLAERYRVIAPDLRGLGGSTRAADGYDAENQAADIAGLLDALDIPSAAVVAIDASVAPAFLFALHHLDRVRRLVLMEAALGALPGAEDFLAAGPPWWFGFHAVPGLADTVLAGHESAYIDWFLDIGTLGRGVPRPIRDAFVAAYTGTEALRSAFGHYRAMSVTADQIRRAVATARLTMPTLAVGAHPVGGALERQLRPIADDLTGHVLTDCGHIIPLDGTAPLLALLKNFLAAPHRTTSFGAQTISATCP